MEFTAKGIAAVVLPAMVLALGNIVDNSMQWRAEMKQRQYDRQTRIIDKILEIPQAEHRIASATFYLKTGTFTGDYKSEVEMSLKLAQEELMQTRALAEEAQRLAAREAEERDRSKLMAMAPGYAEPPPPVEETLEPNPGFSIPSTIPEIPEVPVEAAPIPQLPSIGPRTIFSYDKAALQ